MGTVGCALLSSERVECWGFAPDGEVGNGTFTGSAPCGMGQGGLKGCYPTPTPVSNLTGVVSVAVGHYHACALLAMGGVECWGFNAGGELGIGTTTGPSQCSQGDPCSPIPVAVSGLVGVTAISAGASDTCALLADGTVECWGGNSFGQIASVPAPVPGLQSVTAITSGAAHHCALLSDMTVKCWGNDDFGQLGNGTIGADAGLQGCGGDGGALCSEMPLAVNGLSGVTALASGDDYTCALMSDQTVECWGADGPGELGNGLYNGKTLTPTPVTGLSNVIAIAASSQNTCALLAERTVECWGLNAYGTLGDGDSAGPDTCGISGSCSATPVAVSGLTGVASIAVGNGAACAVLMDGTVECWGLNSNAMLGIGTTTGPEQCSHAYDGPYACSTMPVVVKL